MDFKKIIRYNSLPSLADISVDLKYIDYLNYNALPLWKASINIKELGNISLAPLARIFVKTDFLHEAINYFDTLSSPIHLITGVSDINPLSIDGVDRIIKNKNIVSWVGNNLPKVDAKILTIPIGFTELSRGHDSFEFYKISKENRAILTPHGDTSAERVIANIFLDKPNSNVVPIYHRLDKEQYFNSLYKYKFSICLPGNGMDTHRFYESIAMQAIPIVMRSPISDLHLELGAIVIDSLEELDEKFFQQHAGAKVPDSLKITLEYQKDKILNFQNQMGIRY